MTSVLSFYAQRNNNITEIIPERLPNDLSFLSINNSAVYAINIFNSNFIGGIYTIDLSGIDSFGNDLDFN